MQRRAAATAFDDRLGAAARRPDVGLRPVRLKNRIGRLAGILSDDPVPGRPRFQTGKYRPGPQRRRRNHPGGIAGSHVVSARHDQRRLGQRAGPLGRAFRTARNPRRPGADRHFHRRNRNPLRRRLLRPYPDDRRQYNLVFQPMEKSVAQRRTGDPRTVRLAPRIHAGAARCAASARNRRIHGSRRQLPRLLPAGYAARTADRIDRRSQQHRKTGGDPDFGNHAATAPGRETDRTADRIR